jgi:hypothetical protein
VRRGPCKLLSKMFQCPRAQSLSHSPGDVSPGFKYHSYIHNLSSAQASEFVSLLYTDITIWKFDMCKTENDFRSSSILPLLLSFPLHSLVAQATNLSSLTILSTLTPSLERSLNSGHSQLASLLPHGSITWSLT